MIGPLDGRPIVEHQQRARDRFDDKQEERQAAHAPGVAERDPVFGDRDRMQVQDKVGQHDRHAVAAVPRRRMPKDALPELRAADSLA
jgi:hypothetical protein